MPRALRPYMPGVPFHLIAQVAFRERLLNTDYIKAALCDYLQGALEKTDALLRAFCLMDNHMHLVVVQGLAPLAQLMRPFLIRSALLVHRVHRRRGRVFSGPFLSMPCLDPYYLREAIVYTHLNPCRAGITKQPESYQWSSHQLYLGAGEATNLSKFVVPELSVFADESDSATPAEYMQYVNYRLRFDDDSDHSQLLRPSVRNGNLAWNKHYSPHFVQPEWKRVFRPDLRDVALQTMQRCLPGVSVDSLRMRHCSKEFCAARAQIVIAAHNAGHRGSAIARFLNISDARVSQITSRAYGKRPVTRSMEAWAPQMSEAAKT